MSSANLTIDDLPQLTVESLEVAGDDVTIKGSLSDFTGIRLGRAWLYKDSDRSFVADLLDLDEKTRRATLVTSHSALDCGLVIGAVFPCLDGYWEPFQIDLVRRLGTQWVRLQYIPERGYAIDHEQCGLCLQKIGPRFEAFGYRRSEDAERPNRQGPWICERCYRKYVEPHDLSFVNELHA